MIICISLRKMPSKKHMARDAFDDLFPHGLLGSEELSAFLYRGANVTLKDYTPMNVMNQLREENILYSDAGGWDNLAALLITYKQQNPTLTPVHSVSPVPIPVISPVISPSVTKLPPIVIEPPTVTAGVTVGSVIAEGGGGKPPVVGAIVPFTIDNEPPKMISSKLGDLKTLKVSTPPLRLPGTNKKSLMPIKDKDIVIPTSSSTTIIPDKPFTKPIVTGNVEQIAAYTNEQSNLDAIIKDWDRVNNAHGPNSYKVSELKSFAKAYGLPVSNATKSTLVNILREHGAKLGLIKEA